MREWDENGAISPAGSEGSLPCLTFVPTGSPSRMAGRLCHFGGKVTQRGVGNTMGVLGIGRGDPVEERSQVTHSAVSVAWGCGGQMVCHISSSGLMGCSVTAHGTRWAQI